MKFVEAKLEAAFIELIEKEGYTYQSGSTIEREMDQVIIEGDLRAFLQKQYSSDGISQSEKDSIILQIKSLPSSDLYESNKKFIQILADGFILKREDPTQKDIHIELIDYSQLEKYRHNFDENFPSISAEEEARYSRDRNIYKFVNQLEIEGGHKRIPDGIIYINGLPLVVLEFKSAIRENATIYDAYEQISIRYRRDIPELFKYNAFCVISDGVNSKAGSLFAHYDYYYSWRRVDHKTIDAQGINSFFSLIQGMFNKYRLRDIIRNFIHFPDNSKKEIKIVCSYPQYYAATALFENIKTALKPQGDGKGGTYFGATGSGKSFAMLFLTRLLMKSEAFGSPTIVLITDRTDLDDQLSEQFIKAKTFIGDNNVISVSSRENLRELLKNRQSGGVFLTTIHKFNEDTELLTERSNVICISDEAHRSQVNLEQKIIMTDSGIKKVYGFAKHLHDSLPNATYVGFTGTPIDATIDVFGPVIEAYTMAESVQDEITVSIVYEGRAAKVILDNSQLQKIEDYYDEAAELGANEYQIDKSKRETAKMHAILGDPDRLQAVAEDFIEHYENRLNEGGSVMGKAMFVCSNRNIAYELYKKIIELRPHWNEIKAADENAQLTEKEKKETTPIERIKLVMTRGQNDPEELWNMLGTPEDRRKLDLQFKNSKSNFKIAIVVDMWLTGFDVPFLDTIYIDKPIQEHSLIQTISRVNRRYKGKNKGLVVDYIGIKNHMNFALAKYSKGDERNFEDIEQSLIVVRNHLDLLAKIMHPFNNIKYFEGTPLEQLETLNRATEFIQQTDEKERRFMDLVKRLKAAYDICSGSEELLQTERDYTHFYLAIRSIIRKLSKGEAPDTEKMNARVTEMVKEALQSDGVEEILKIGDEADNKLDIFDQKYLEQIDKIDLPNTKIKLLIKLLSKAIGEIRKVNKFKGVDFSHKMERVVKEYNDREEKDFSRNDFHEEVIESLTNLIYDIQKEYSAGDELGIDFEEKAFYDILKELCIKFGFTYPENKLIELSKEVKKIVDNHAKFPDWNKREDIKSALKVALIMLMDQYDYPPKGEEEVYVELFEQAENYKKYNT
ncbi:MAG: type I restriction endonuclease subunit R [Bacteroidales bacterium]